MDSPCVILDVFRTQIHLGGTLLHPTAVAGQKAMPLAARRMARRGRPEPVDFAGHGGRERERVAFICKLGVGVYGYTFREPRTHAAATVAGEPFHYFRICIGL